jgi:hypothetical protein
LFLKIRLFGCADSFGPTSRTGINVKILIHPTGNCRIEVVDLISHQGLWYAPSPLATNNGHFGHAVCCWNGCSPRFYRACASSGSLV